MDRRSGKQLTLWFSICLLRTMVIYMFFLLRNRQEDSAGRTPAAQVLSQPLLHDGFCTFIELRKRKSIRFPPTNNKNPYHFLTRTWHSHEHDMENHPNKLWPHFHFAYRGPFSSWEIIIQMTISSKLLWIIKIMPLWNPCCTCGSYEVASLCLKTFVWFPSRLTCFDKFIRDGKRRRADPNVRAEVKQ